MTSKHVIFLVFAVVALSSGGAFSGPAYNRSSTTNCAHTAKSIVERARFLRATDYQDSTLEERFTKVPTELKTMTETITRWVNGKLAKMTSYLRRHFGRPKSWSKEAKQKKFDRKVEKAKQLIDEGATQKTLLKNKITPDVYYKALGLHESLKKSYSNTIANGEKYPDLARWYGYMEYYKANRWDIVEILNHLKRKVRLAE